MLGGVLSGPASVTEALKRFTSVEQLDGDNKYKCVLACALLFLLCCAAVQRCLPRCAVFCQQSTAQVCGAWCCCFGVCIFTLC